MQHYFVTEQDSLKLVSTLLVEYGISPTDAQIVADHLTQAEMRGLASHGLQRLNTYIPKLRNGEIKTHPKHQIIHDKGASVQYDADYAFGMISGVAAMNLCIERARQYGVGCVNVTNANHYGYLAYYAEMALREDMVAICFCTSKAITAPYGSNERALGTNPICLAVPAKERRPIIYDGATSVVAQGKIAVASLEERMIPNNWAYDLQGKPTHIAIEALKGALMPMGEYKGSGIAMLISLICCGLGNVLYDMEKADFHPTCVHALEQGLDQMFLVLDICAFTNVEVFKHRVDGYAKIIKGLRHDNDTGGIFLPGEKEDICMDESRASGGFKISQTLYDNLQNLYNEANIDCGLKRWKSI